MPGIKSIAERRTDVFWLNPLYIAETPGWNVRYDNQDLRDHIRFLADSIKEIGVKQPLTVYMEGDVPTVTDGHCRLMAVNLAISEGADIKSIPVRVEEKYSNIADRALSMLVRNSGKPLEAREKAKAVKLLIDFGWPMKDICAKTGFSPSKVQDFIALLSASPVVNEMIDKGEVSPTTAARAIRKHGNKGGEEKLQEAVDKAKDEGKVKASINDVLPSEDKIAPVQIFNDGFHSGMLHALALLINYGGELTAAEVREALFGDAKIKISLAGIKDRAVLQAAFEDLK